MKPSLKYNFFLLLVFTAASVKLVNAAELLPNALNQVHQGGFVITNYNKLPLAKSFTNQQTYLSKKMYESRFHTINTKTADDTIIIAMRSNTLIEINPNYFVEGAFVKHNNKIFRGLATFFLQTNSTFHISDELGKGFITLYAEIDETGPTIKLLPLTQYTTKSRTLIFGKRGEIAFDIADENMLTSIAIHNGTKHFVTYTNAQATPQKEEKKKTLDFNYLQFIKKKKLAAGNNVQIKLAEVANGKNLFTLHVNATDSLGNSSSKAYTVAISQATPKVEVFIQTGVEVKRLSSYIVNTKKNPSFFLNSENNKIFYAIATRQQNTTNDVRALNFKAYTAKVDEVAALKVSTKQNLYYYAEDALGNRSILQKIVVQLPSKKRVSKSEAVKVR